MGEGRDKSKDGTVWKKCFIRVDALRETLAVNEAGSKLWYFK